MTLNSLHRWQWQITSRNGRSVISLARKTSMEYRTIGYNGVSRWCPNMKWGRRGLWWLDSRQDSEHRGSKKAEKDAGGCLHRNQASGQLQEFAPRVRRRRREDEVDLGSRCKVDRRQRSIFVYINAACVTFEC